MILYVSMVYRELQQIRKFMNGEIPVFGSYISEYEDEMSLMRNSIKVNINNLKTKKEVLQWYC